MASHQIKITVEPYGSSWAVTTNPYFLQACVRDHIEWDITAPPGVSVDVNNFHVTSTPPSKVFTGAPTKSNNKIKATLKDSGFAPIYKYEVWITDSNGEQWYVDPEVQIKE